jgi:hypothetical protein
MRAVTQDLPEDLEWLCIRASQQHKHESTPQARKGIPRDASNTKLLRHHIASADSPASPVNVVHLPGRCAVNSTGSVGRIR